MYDIYSCNEDDSQRYLLGHSGQRLLIAVGLNPSTATSERSDPTVAKVERVAQDNGFDGFAMLNLYPVRATRFLDLSEQRNDVAHQENLSNIRSFLLTQKEVTLWAAWGASMFARPFIVNACADLLGSLAPLPISWKHFGPLTKHGHPRHPSRLSYAWTLEPFDTVTYHQTLRAWKARNVR